MTYPYSRVVVVALAALALSGCAAQSSDETTPSSAAPVSAQTTCEALTDPMSEELNATYSFQANQIDKAAYEAVLVETAADVRSVPVEPSTDLADAISAFSAYGNALDASGNPTVNTDGYANAQSVIALACSAEGTDLVVRSNVGG